MKDRQRILVCCSPGGQKELDMTEQLKNNKSINKYFKINDMSNTLVWRIPWKDEPGVLQFIRLQRVGHEEAI